MAERIAIVTGGSGGIGAAICRDLADRGLDVLVGYRSGADAAAKVAADCAGTAEPIHLDVTDAASVATAVAEAEARGRLAVLVHAAGAADDDLLLRLEPDAWDRTMEVNLRGTYLACRAALRPMLRARWGRIVLLTSIVGRHGNAGQTAYAAAKAGMDGFVRALAREVGRKGVTVNSVAPGFVETAMTADLPDDVRRAYVEGAPIRRAVTAEEVAATVGFLVSDAAAAITGVTVPVDGGAGI